MSSSSSTSLSAGGALVVSDVQPNGDDDEMDEKFEGSSGEVEFILTVSVPLLVIEGLVVLDGTIGESVVFLLTNLPAIVSPPHLTVAVMHIFESCVDPKCVRSVAHDCNEHANSAAWKRRKHANIK